MCTCILDCLVDIACVWALSETKLNPDRFVHHCIQNLILIKSFNVMDEFLLFESSLFSPDVVSIIPLHDFRGLGCFLLSELLINVYMYNIVK